MNLTVR